METFKNSDSLSVEASGVFSKQKFMNPTILEASYFGDKDKVELLIDAGTDVNYKDNLGNTALIFAAKEGHKEIVELLIKAGADVDHGNISDTRALMSAAVTGHKEIVELLIKVGVDINLQDEIGETALIVAAAVGNQEIVELLIDAGADVNSKNNDGVTALMDAACNGHKDIVKLLIEAGADINLKNNQGETALMYVQSDLVRGFRKPLPPQLRHAKLKVVQLLISRADMAGIQEFILGPLATEVVNFLGTEDAYRSIRFFNQAAEEKAMYEKNHELLDTMRSITDIEHFGP